MEGLEAALGCSPSMRSLRERLERIVSAGPRRLPPILLEGETGTGKSFLAGALHRASARAKEPFVSVNCAAIPRELLEAELFGYERGAFTGARAGKPGLFQAASRGTLLLDEIGYLSEPLQAKLLTVLEERAVRRLGSTQAHPVDVWVMAATNADLRRATREGAFLEALFHRLAVVTIPVPPLRERGDDVIALAEKLLERACAHYEVPRKTLTDEARAALRAYSFPGNVRELGNMMERVALLERSERVTRAMLELPDGAAPDDGPTSSATDDPEQLVAALAANDWNISRAAAQLGIPRSTLRSRISRHGLTRAGARAAPPPVLVADAPQRIAVVEIVPGRPDDPPHEVASIVELALDKARSFGAHATSARAAAGRAVFGLDRFEDGARTALAAARAVGRAAAAHGSEHRVLFHVGRFGSHDDIDRVLPPPSTIASFPCGLVLSDSAAALLRRQVDSEPIGDGWRRVRDVHPFGLSPGGGLAAFVGRSLDVALVRRRLEAAAGGTGQLVGIQGEAGVGKSRLVAEVVPAATALGFVHVECAAIAHGKSMPYLPVLEVVRALCGASESDDALALTAKIDAELERLGLGAELAAPLLRLLGVGEREAGTSPEGAQAQIQRAVVDLVVAAARVAPLFLVFEDVQWLDGGSQEVLSALAQRASSAPMVLLTTYRPGAAPPWMSRPQATQLSVLPLSPEEAGQLACAVIGDAQPSAETVHAIVARADGNPFFIEELSLTVGAGPAAHAAALPESIVDVVSGRIVALEAPQRRTLLTASVAGRACPWPLLAKLLPDEPDLEARVDELARLDLVYEKSRARERTIVFRHAITQEIAYGMLSETERRSLHGAAARALEAAHANRHDDVIELLAHHHARGDDPERAVDVLARAAGKAVASNVLDTARAAHDEAARILASLPPTPENRRRRVRLYVEEHTVPLFFLLLRVEELLRTLEELEPEAERLGDPALIGMLHARKGHCLWWVGRLDESVAAGERCLELLEPLGMPTLAAHTFMLNALYAKGDFQRILRIEPRVVEVIERERHVRWSAYALGVLAWTHSRLGHRERAIAAGERALAMARDKADVSVSSFAHWSLAIVLTEMGDVERALDHAHRAVADAPTPADRMWAESVRAGIYCRRTEEDAARGTAILRPLVADLRRSGLFAAEELFTTALGEGYLRLGKIDDARAVFEELLARAERYGMRYLEAFACGWLARIAQSSGAPAGSMRERADRILSELTAPGPS